MAAKTRRQYAGGAAQTSLVTSITSVATSASVASTTGWPSTPAVPFYVVIDPDTSVEEKCLATISGSTLTLTRGQDGTVASAHDAGATIYPVFTAVDADEANELASKFTAKGDIVTQGASTFETTSVGTNNQLLKADSSAAGGVAWATYSPVITLGGDLTGSVTLTNLGSGTLTATVAANSVALGTDTTGNYVSDVTAGTGITVTHTPGEGSSAAVAIDGTVATLTGSQTLTNKTVALGSNTVSGTKAEFDTALTDDNFAYVGTANTFTTNQVISASSSSDLLRITQTGAGNALVVEDSANPDSTPFVVFNDGKVAVGSTTNTGNAMLDIFADTSLGLNIRSAGASGGRIMLQRNAGTIASPTAVAADNILGQLRGDGYDGTSYLQAANINLVVDGAVSTGTVPGRIIFSTGTAGTTTERMRIDSAGQVGIGAAAVAGRSLAVTKQITGSTNAIAVVSNGTIQSDVTAEANSFRSSINTAAASFTLTNLIHFYAAPSATPGAGSTITTQIGFAVANTMTGASTNNYAFYGDIASGAGRFNLVMNGTAANYLAGRLGVGATLTSGAMALINNTTASDVALLVRGAANQSGAFINVQNSATTSVFSVNTGGNLLVASNIGSSDAGIEIGQSRTADGNALLDLVGDTTYTDFGARFLRAGGANGNTSVSHRGTGVLNIVAVDGGTVSLSTSNVIRLTVSSSGAVGIATAPNAAVALDLRKTITGGATAYGVFQAGAIQSDVTATAHGYSTSLSTQAAAFTLTNLIHYRAIQSTIGATSTVTNQYGFWVDASLTGATNNYGFYGNIASGSNRWNLYMEGTADNYLAGSLGIGATPSAGYTVRVAKNITGATTGGSVVANGTVQSDVTTAYHSYQSFVSLAAASFTLQTLNHFTAGQSTIGAGAAVTNQIGFRVDSNMTGATNNYGFRGLIASGSSRYNLFMDGTADNYLAGRLGVGATLTSGAMAQVVNTTAADIALIVQGAASQSGDLLSVRNSAATALFTIGSGGQLRANTSTDVSPLVGVTPDIQLSGTGNDASMGINRFSANADPSRLLFVKSRNATIGSHTVVADNDNIMTIQALASDGTSYIEAARITASVDGTPGTNDMPGRLVFATTADGGTTLTERMRITNAGNIGFNMSTFSGALVLAIGNGTAPTANPSNGGYLYVESGALKYRGSSGTVTTIANA